MAWQVLAMWLIVGSTIVWFIRDERRQRAEALSARALQFAYAPHYRRPPMAAPPLPPQPAPRTLKSADRAYLLRYLKADS